MISILFHILCVAIDAGFVHKENIEYVAEQAEFLEDIDSTNLRYTVLVIYIQLNY